MADVLMTAGRADRPERDNVQQLRQMILGTYLEMPGLMLTLDQAARFFGIEAGLCQSMLDHLAASGKLRRRPVGAYVLA